MASVLPTHRQDTRHDELDEQPHGFFQLHRGQRKDSIDNHHRLALIRSYAPDWILTIVVAGLFFLLDKVSGFKREFSIDETSIQHTYAVHERVPTPALYMLAIIGPLVIMAIINLLSIRSFWDLHTSWLGAILGLSLAGTFTQFIKVTVGRPRPDLIDRCQLPAGTINHPGFGLVNATACTQTDFHILNDGFRSFPSGHSSLSFAGLGFLSLYMAGKLHLFDNRGYTGKAWLSAVPLMVASLVAISRTMDYRHHWHDVVAGSLLGLFFAWFSYRQYYPSLYATYSHRPYSPRVSRLRAPLPPVDDREYISNQAVRVPLINETRASREYQNMELHDTEQGKPTIQPSADSGNSWKPGNGIPPPGREQERV